MLVYSHVTKYKVYTMYYTVYLCDFRWCATFSDLCYIAQNNNFLAIDFGINIIYTSSVCSSIATHMFCVGMDKYMFCEYSKAYLFTLSLP